MPYYPQSKGKVERTVGYVKQNCLAHLAFESREALKVHVTHWLDTVADAKVIRAADGTRFATMERFAEEKPYLKTMERPSFLNVTSMNKRYVACQQRYYPLPVEYAGREVQVRVVGEELEVFDARRTFRRFNKTSGATKVITYETALDPKNPGFGNTIGEPPALKGIVSTPTNNPLCRSFEHYAKILGGCHG